jgi:TRAP-type C4-dicarboxylate transport system permease small subunit
MGKSRIAAFYNGVKKVNLLCATLAGILLLFVTLSIFVDVFLRYVFSRPSIWITEVSSYLFLYMIYLATAYTLQVGTHINVTFLLDPLSPRVKRIVNLVTSNFGILFTAVLLWQSSIMTWSAFKGNWTSPTILSAPYVYIHGVMVLGSFLLLLTYICTTILEFRGGDTAEEKGGDKR